MKILKKFSLVFLLLVSFPLVVSVAFASSGFATLPLGEFPRLMQGWNYTSNFSGRAHQGIDYYASAGTDLIASADGVASRYQQAGSNFSYGNFVVVDHGNGYKTLYAHLGEVDAKITKNTFIKRGEVIGRSGMTGTDNPHLHFETLTTFNNGKGPNRGYGWRIDPYDIYNVSAYYPPTGTKFSKCGDNYLWTSCPPEVFSRPGKATLTISETNHNSATLSWTKPEVKSFSKYDLYRSTSENGTTDPSARVLAGTFNSPDTLSYKDSALSPNTKYYYSLFTYDTNGSFSMSEEASTETTNGLKNITDNEYDQRRPSIDGKTIVWNDNRRAENNKTESKIFFYNLEKEEGGELNVSYVVESPKNPVIHGDKIVFTGVSSNRFKKGYGDNIYVYYSVTGFATPISEATGSQTNPDIYGSTIVWQDDRDKSKQSDIYMLDFDDGGIGEIPIINEGGSQTSPKVWDGRVAYVDSIIGKNKGSKVMLYDIATKEKTVIASDLSYPQISFDEGKVMWVTDKKIFVYDIFTKKTDELKTKNVITAIMKQKKVVYQTGNEAKKTDVRIYDLVTGKDTVVFTEIDGEAQVDFEDGVLVFDNPSENAKHPSFHDIFMIRIE